MKLTPIHMSRRKQSPGCIGSIVRLIAVPFLIAFNLIAIPFKVTHYWLKPSRKKKGDRVWIEEVNQIPGMRPTYEARGPAMEMHFELSNQIELAWIKWDRGRIIKLCEAHIDICEDVRRALRMEAKANRSPQDLNQSWHTGFYRLAMNYPRKR